eukprot:7365242-Pyramimonas_sp.AAC.1
MDTRCAGRRMWTLPLGPSVKLSLGHETRARCADMNMRWAGGRMLTLPLGPSMELPLGARNV